MCQRWCLFCGLCFVLLLCVVFPARSATYVGSEACQECHSQEYASFKNFAKKAHSYQSVLKLADTLSPEELEGCYSCHTTGYGNPGGFLSFEKTPHLANLGCETCHGPGSDHINQPDKDSIISKIDLHSCSRCHSQERVDAFKYKPMLFGGAH